MNIKGVYLEGIEVYGNIYEIFNKVFLGIIEEDIMS